MEIITRNMNVCAHYLVKVFQPFPNSIAPEYETEIQKYVVYNDAREDEAEEHEKYPRCKI